MSLRSTIRATVYEQARQKGENCRPISLGGSTSRRIAVVGTSTLSSIKERLLNDVPSEQLYESAHNDSDVVRPSETEEYSAEDVAKTAIGYVTGTKRCSRSFVHEQQALLASRISRKCQQPCMKIHECSRIRRLAGAHCSCSALTVGCNVKVGWIGRTQSCLLVFNALRPTHQRRRISCCLSSIAHAWLCTCYRAAASACTSPQSGAPQFMSSARPDTCTKRHFTALHSRLLFAISVACTGV